jgi:predicted ATPase
VEILRKNNFFILAGTSGTGKTAVLRQLRSLGFSCSDEAARAVLREQLVTDGPALPSKSPLLFIEQMMERSIKSFEDLIQSDESCFFDRAMPDLVHYATRFNVDPSAFKKASEKYRYNKTVFLFPPWREIFVNDNERRMTFEMSIEFHQLLVQTYQDFDYTLIKVPQLPISSRAEFILENIKS